MDVAWTELKARGDEMRAWIAYKPLPNAVYAVMKGSLNDEPLAGRGPGNIGDLWESFATYLMVGKSTPDWAGIRSLLLRALNAQKAIDIAQSGETAVTNHWTDVARRWRPGNKKNAVPEPPTEDS